MSGQNLTDIHRKKKADAGFPVEKIREDFPVLKQTVYGKPLVYLDNAATAQKPRAVIDTLDRFYSTTNANIHRGIYDLSERATRAYEQARAKAQHFLNAKEVREIVFVRGTTEGINLVAQSYGRANLKAGDEILITAMEHHSNIVPWQLLSEELGTTLRVAPINDEGELLIDEFEKLLNEKTKFVSVVYLSNVLGTVNPVKTIIELAHRRNIPVLLDGAQAVPHLSVDVQELDCDFFVFSGHKLFGPTGIGVLYGKADRLEAMPPYHGGGDMIRSVSFDRSTYREIPYKFEAGTPNVADVIGLGAAIDYLTALDIRRVKAYEDELLRHALQTLSSVSGIRFIGTAKEKAALVSFVLGDIHPHDISTILDREGVAVRAGHHCAMPVMTRFGVPATVRASFAFYNTKAEIDTLVRSLQKVKEVFG